MHSFLEGAVLAVSGDITRQSVDAIVNAANSSLLGGGGVDGAIHRAGGPAILAECKRIVLKIGHLPAGKAVLTTGGRLPAKYVIHTVGPVYGGGKRNEAATLAAASNRAPAIALKIIRIVVPTLLPTLIEVHLHSVDAIRSGLHSVLDDPDAIAASVGVPGVLLFHVGDAAQREGDLPA